MIDTLNDRFGDFTGHLDRNPRIAFVKDEARSYIARQKGKFDFIQLSVIDTAIASAVGNFASEKMHFTPLRAGRAFSII